MPLWMIGFSFVYVRDVITAPSGTSPGDALSVIKEHKLGRLPIVNVKGELVWRSDSAPAEIPCVIQLSSQGCESSKCQSGAIIC